MDVRVGSPQYAEDNEGLALTGGHGWALAAVLDAARPLEEPRVEKLSALINRTRIMKNMETIRMIYLSIYFYL